MTTTARPTVETGLEAMPAETSGGWLSTVVVLFKLRVVMLLLFAALGGALIGSAGAPAAGDLALLVLTGTLSAGGASALNQYLERHKTVDEAHAPPPLVTGQVNARVLLLVASGMVVGPALWPGPQETPGWRSGWPWARSSTWASIRSGSSRAACSMW